MDMKFILPNKLTWNKKCFLCLLPSLAGISIFYIIPFIRVLYYSFINNQFQRKFIGLGNYIKALQNDYFMLGLKNSIWIILLCVPILIILALIISIGTFSLFKKTKSIRTIFILPMVISTASMVMVWKMIFSNITNIVPIYSLFIWKNIGICIILLTSALTTIDKSIYEAANIDGVSRFHLHTKITIPIITPACLFAILLSIVNSFRIFKESYLYYGSQYPPNHSYTLQYYMNNNFLKFNYQALATSSVLTTILVLGIVLIGLKIQRRYSFDTYN